VIATNSIAEALPEDYDANVLAPLTTLVAALSATSSAFDHMDSSAQMEASARTFPDSLP
jgi:hypothetical protein